MDCQVRLTQQRLLRLLILSKFQLVGISARYAWDEFELAGEAAELPSTAIQHHAKNQPISGHAASRFESSGNLSRSVKGRTRGIRSSRGHTHVGSCSCPWEKMSFWMQMIVSDIGSWSRSQQQVSKLTSKIERSRSITITDYIKRATILLPFLYHST